MDTETVPTRFARSLLNLVMERGYDYSGILEVANISFNPLNPRAPGYQNQITAMQYTRLYQQVLSLLQDEAFGLLIGHGVTPGAFRMMCYCIIGCENLGKAIKRACEFYRTFFDADAQIYLEMRGDQAAVGYSGSRGSEERAPVGAAEVYGLLVWHRFFCWLIGNTIELQVVRFRGTEPGTERAAKYRHLFDCPVNYSQDRNQFVFDARFLSSPLIHNEQSLKEFLRTVPYPLMVMNHSHDDGSLVARVRKLIGHDFSQGFPGFERITDALNMSAPTLRRRLRKEGTTFQQLKDECRRDAAMAYLANSDLSINAIAALMGFTDPSAFHRCFKKWTEMTPGEYRQREQDHRQAS